MSDHVTEVDEAEGIEMCSFKLIAAAGTARSLAFMALKAARDSEFDRADELLLESKQAGIEAHHQQTALLVKEANGEHVPVDVTLVHAQDHLMTSMLAQELIEEIVCLYKRKADRV